jgi:hypothetical protein
VTGIGWRMERVCDAVGQMATGVLAIAPRLTATAPRLVSDRGARMLPRAGNFGPHHPS